MTNTKDIYYKMNQRLIEENYWALNMKEKKELINNELIKYTVTKIQELNPHFKYDQSMDITNLLEIFNNLIDEEEKFEVLRHFSHYIISIASSLQEYEIIWWVESDKDLIDNPICDFNEENKWNTLTTHQKTDLIKTFKLVNETFNNNFLNHNKAKTKMS